MIRIRGAIVPLLLAVASFAAASCATAKLNKSDIRLKVSGTGQAIAVSIMNDSAKDVLLQDQTVLMVPASEIGLSVEVYDDKARKLGLCAYVDGDPKRHAYALRAKSSTELKISVQELKENYCLSAEKVYKFRFSLGLNNEFNSIVYDSKDIEMRIAP